MAPFLVHIALVCASLFGVVALPTRLNAEAIRQRFGPGLRLRLVAGFLVAADALLAAIWIGDLIRRLRTGEPIDCVSRSVYAIDLLVVLAAMVVALMLTLLTNSVLVVNGASRWDPAQSATFRVTAAASLACTTVSGCCSSLKSC